MTQPSFTAFTEELQKIKSAGLRSWLSSQHDQLGHAAAQAMMSGPRPVNPFTGQHSIPMTGTISNFITNKLPTPTKPPGAIIGGAKKLLDSKPVRAAMPIFDQASELMKLAQVKPYQQKTQYSCSAACLKAVLEHWGADRYAEHEVMHAIGVHDKRGAEVDEITEGAKALGFDAYDKCFSSLEEAKEVTPIIADFQSFNNPGKGHYVVITAIEDDVVHLMDPNTEGNERVITRAECEKRWWDRTMAPPHKLMPKWGVVVTPKGQR